MTYTDLISEFTSGDLSACISKGEIFLLENPRHQDALFLMAVAHHDIVYDEGPMTIFMALEQHSIPFLKRLLAQDPLHAKALYTLLAYTLINQADLKKDAIAKQHIQEANKSEFIAYASRLITNSDMEQHGYDFLVQLYEIFADVENQTLYIEKGLQFCAINFAEDREMRDRETSVFILKKIKRLNQEPTGKKAMLDLLRKELKHFVSPFEKDFFDLAAIAFAQQDLPLTLEILLKVLERDYSTEEVVQNFIHWHGLLKPMLSIGIESHSISYILLIIERNYFEEMDIPESSYYHNALNAIDTYPEGFAGYHFAGTYLFEQQLFAQATPYLKKALALNPLATTWRRYFTCNFYLNHEVAPTIALNSSALACYNQAIELDDLSQEISIPELQMQLAYGRLGLYEQAYAKFKAYFEADEEDSFYAIDRQAWAMCCNNLAIVYSNLKRYTESAEIAEIGLEQADFWELHVTLIDALVLDKNYVSAHAALTRYFANYEADDIPFAKHLQLLANKCESEFFLANNNDLPREVKTLMLQIYDYGIANEDMSAYDYRDFEAAKSTIQSVYYLSLATIGTEERIALFENLALRYPKEPNPAYMLMQLYFDSKRYSLSNQQAQLYLKLKPEDLLDPYDHAKTIHFILKTKILMQEYTSALALYESNKLLVREALPDEDYCLWLDEVISLFFSLGYKDDVHLFLEKYQAIYEDNKWDYDESIGKIRFLLAQNLQEMGNNHLAIKQLKQILTEDPSHQAALQLAELCKKKLKESEGSWLKRFRNYFSK